MRRTRFLRFGFVVLLGSVAAAALINPTHRARTEQPAGPPKEAVERARATVKLLDDLHKSYVVQITATYVRAQEKTPAATVAKKVLGQMEKAGHGSGRLVDATGKPFNEDNLPKSDFEKKAVAAIKGGKPYFDEVGVKDGKPVLRAATIVPVVMPQCINCHAGHKEGDLLGALIYEVPIR